MTIRSNINPAALERRLKNLEWCIDASPPGMHEIAPAVKDVIDCVMTDLIDRLADAGLKADCADGARELEACIYGYILESNDDHSGFVVAEAAGERA